MNKSVSKQIGRSHYTPDATSSKTQIKTMSNNSINVELVKFFSGWTVLIAAFIVAANVSVFAMEKFGGIVGVLSFTTSLVLLYKPVQYGLKRLQS